MIDPAATGDHTVNKQQQQCKVISFALLFWVFPFLWITVLLPYTVCCYVSFTAPSPHTAETFTNIHAHPAKQKFSRGDKQASLQTPLH